MTFTLKRSGCARSLFWQNRSGMKVLLISNYPPDKQQSMLRYARFLQNELQSRGVLAEIVYPPVVLGRLRFLPRIFEKWIGYVDKYLIAPAYLFKRAMKADVVHVCDHSNAMYLRWAAKRPALITCHDTIAIFAARGSYPGVRIGITGRIQQHWIATNLVRARRIVCVSANTQDDLERLEPGIRSRTTVIRHHLNWRYSPALPDGIALAKRNCALEPQTEYLLHVGGNQWYKNRIGTMQIFSALRRYERFRRVKLVMAGKPWTTDMRNYRISSGLMNEIIERIDVSNEELCALYSGAIALLFPSLEEGFGWPILEAQACGCPVITSNRAPMTEIAGGGAIFIDATAPEQAARTIAENASLLQSLRIAGFGNLDRFSKSAMIESYQELYEFLEGERAQVTREILTS